MKMKQFVNDNHGLMLGSEEIDFKVKKYERELIDYFGHLPSEFEIEQLKLLKK